MARTGAPDSARIEPGPEGTGESEIAGERLAEGEGGGDPAQMRLLLDLPPGIGQGPFEGIPRKGHQRAAGACRLRLEPCRRETGAGNQIAKAPGTGPGSARDLDDGAGLRGGDPVEGLLQPGQARGRSMLGGLGPVVRALAKIRRRKWLQVARCRLGRRREGRDRLDRVYRAGEPRKLALAGFDQALPLRERRETAFEAATGGLTVQGRPVEGPLQRAEPLLVGELHCALARDEAGQHLVVEDEVIARRSRPEDGERETDAEEADEDSLGGKAEAGGAADPGSRWHDTSDVLGRPTITLD